MFTISNMITNMRARGLQSLLKQQQELIIAGVLLLAMLLILLSPTLKPVRTVEVLPSDRVVTLDSGSSLTTTVAVPEGALAYFVAWVEERYKEQTMTAADYETIRLEVRSPAGDVVRTVVGPAMQRKSGEMALVFAFDPLKVAAGEQYSFVVTQTGDGTVWLREPHPDMVEDGEAVAAAFQLGQQKNWVTLLFDKVYGEDLVGHDISFYYHRGKQIVNGYNPYSCVLDPGETCIGYPSHLPGMYLVAAGFVAAGVDSLDEWAAVWRPIMLTAWLGVGLTLLVYLVYQGQPVLAVVALAFWLFNRWSLYVLRVSHTDFVGVLFLVLAVLLAVRRPFVAAFLLGLSLAVKQVAILLVPLFLLVVWQTRPYAWKRLALVAALIVVVPVLTALPFLLTDADAVVAGWLNTATRPAQTQVNETPSFDHWLDVTHAGKSALLLFVVGGVYVAAWRRSIEFIDSVVLVMALIMAFTPVLFHQYFVWLIPFIPLAFVRRRTRPSSTMARS